MYRWNAHMNDSERFDHISGYSVVIHGDESRGHFERNGEALGGLWFERNGNQWELSDYDGTYELPRIVANLLRENGFIVGPDFD